MPDVYEIQGPDGRTIEIEGDAFPTEAELGEIFSRLGATDAPAAGMSMSPDDQTTMIDQAGSDAFWGSLGNTAADTVAGVGRGLVGALNPVNMVKGIGTLATSMVPGSFGSDARERINTGVQQTAAGIASGDPGVGGEAIGGLLGGMVVPRVPGALSATGRGMQTAGNAMGKGPASLALRMTTGQMMGGAGGAVAAAAAPPVLRGMGRVVERTGNMLGGGRASAPTPGAGSASSTAPKAPGTTTRPPVVADMGNVTTVQDLGSVATGPGRSGPAPTPQPRVPVRLGEVLPERPALGPAPSTARETLPPSSLADADQVAMLEQLSASTPAPSSGPAPATSGGGAPLGSLPAGQAPRVKAWKEGHGPSAGDTRILRDTYGSKEAGRMLKARQDQVTNLAPSTDPILPPDVVRRLTEQFATIPPERRQLFVDMAPNPKVRDLLQRLADQP